ncbi:MAG: hypothetical protein HC901_01135 [Bdellovibrionaceae bacterium]|nr:hypothetical protein [Pseudobdellovibrionaceae bacterium]
MLHRITMLNAYKGIYVRGASNSDVKQIYGCAYAQGIRINTNYALSRYKNFNFSPDFLAWSGLVTDSAQLAAHAVAVYNNGSAIEVERMFPSDSSVIGHKIGATWFKEDSNNKSSGGVGGATIRNCRIGVNYEPGIDGMSVTQSTIENCLVAVNTFINGKLTLNEATITNSADWDVYANVVKVDVALANGSVANPAKMNLNGGVVTNETITDDGSGSGEGEEDDKPFETLIEIPSYNDTARLPLSYDLFVVKDPVYAGGAVGDGIHDDTAAVQAAIAAANANGGGIVLFPGGDYRIKQNLTPLAAGVELRGSTAARAGVDEQSSGSTLRIEVADFADNEELEEAFITLGDYGGLRGLGFFYPHQTGGGDADPFKKYPYTVRGNGHRNFIINCTAINSYRFVNFNGDENLLAYSFPGAIREVVYSYGNKNGRYEENICKPANWPNSGFPCPVGKETFKHNIFREGMVLIRLKDCQDYSSGWGSYAHAGFRGLEVENSSGNFGRLSLEAYAQGYAFLSGDKEFIINNKISPRPRPGPDGQGSTFAVKLFPEFKGHVIAHSSSQSSSYDELFDVQGGTLHRYGGAITPSLSGGVHSIHVGEKGSLIMEAVSLESNVGIVNHGSLKFVDCGISEGLPNPYAWTFKADNNYSGVYAVSDMNQLGIRDYGLVLDKNGIVQLQDIFYVEDGVTLMHTTYKTITNSGEFNFTVEDPDFYNNSPYKKYVTCNWDVKANTTVEIWYYSTTGWKLNEVKTFTADDALEETRFKLDSSPAFGRQAAGENYPDLRIVVKSGESPKVRFVKISTSVYGTVAPKAPTGLAVVSDDPATLTWNTVSGLSYNVYRRSFSSGSLGEPLAEGLTSTDAMGWVDASAVPGEYYDYVVTAVDSGGRESGISFDVSVVGNLPPNVSFASPATDLEGIPVGTTLSVVATANDPDGTVASVDLFVNGVYVRTESRTPYEWGANDAALSNLAAGTYLLGLVATDNDGAQSGISSRTVVVEEESPMEVMEAETTTFSGGAIKSDPTASNGQFVDGKGGFTISWSFQADGGNADLIFGIEVPSGSRSMGVFVNGVKIGVLTCTSVTWEEQTIAATLLAGTNVVELRDTEGTDEFNVDYLDVDTIWTTLLADTFDAGWGNWVSGGGDAKLGSDPQTGSQCMNLQNDSGDGSAAWLDPVLDLSGADELMIEFTYFADSMDNSSEDFWVQFSSDGGVSWTTIVTYAAEVDFVNNVRENPVITIDSSSYNFSSNVKLKFRCDASGDSDDVYIDDVVISVR